MLHRLVLALCLSGAAFAAAATEEPSAAAAAPRSTVAAVVAGIVGYTRWPGEATTIHLCTLGRGPGIDELLRATGLGTPQRPVTVRAVAGAAQAGGECQVVYVAGAKTTLARDLLKQLAGRPVLMLGEGAEFCSDGGMFCLEPAATVVRFNANLDAIARSGLRVNPLVLRIARGGAGSGS